MCSVHAPSWADFITTTPVFKFSVHTGCPRKSFFNRFPRKFTSVRNSKATRAVLRRRSVGIAAYVDVRSRSQPRIFLILGASRSAAAHERGGAAGRRTRKSRRWVEDQRRLLTHYSRGKVSPRLIKPYRLRKAWPVGLTGHRNGSGLCCAGARSFPAWRIGMTAPATSSQSAGAVSFRKRKARLLAGRFANIPNVMKREHLRSE